MHDSVSPASRRPTTEAAAGGRMGKECNLPELDTSPKPGEKKKRKTQKPKRNKHTHTHIYIYITSQKGLQRSPKWSPKLEGPLFFFFVPSVFPGPSCQSCSPRTQRSCRNASWLEPRTRPPRKLSFYGDSRGCGLRV